MHRIVEDKIYTSKNGTDIKFVHQKDSLGAFGRVIKEFDPELIIELGTHMGGGTLYFHELCPNADLHTFDIEDVKNKEHLELFTDKVEFRIGDLFDDCKTIVASLCVDDRRKFLYCDNGKKIEEFNYFGGFLNSGDMIGVHDWDVEIHHDDIKKSLKKFTPHRHSVFETKKWLTRLWKKI